MIEALKNYKLGEIKDKEDLLTSTIFGLLRYDKTNSIIKKFIEKAKSQVMNFLYLNEFDDIDYYFWPTYLDKSHNRKEPDLILIFRNKQNSNKDVLILIEAKNWSGAHDGQLLNYYESLFDLSKYEENEISEFKGIVKGMIFLTRFAFEDDIKNTIIALKDRYNSNVPLFGLHWTNLIKICKENENLPLTQDIIDFLNCFSFKSFGGWNLLKTKQHFKKYLTLSDLFYQISFFDFDIKENWVNILNKQKEVIFYG